MDIRKQLIDNIRALSKVKLTLQEVGMAVRNAATHNKAGLTTSLFKIFLAAVYILIVIDVVVKLDILANLDRSLSPRALVMHFLSLTSWHLGMMELAWDS